VRRTRAALLAGAAALLLVAWPKRPRLRAIRILRISRVVADLARAEAFYRDALGFHRAGKGRTDRGLLAALGLADAEAEEVVMRLGAQTIALVQFATLGRRYPPGSRSDDLWFQHLAIVVSDMDAAYAHLSRQSAAWQAISEGGPQLLPPSNGRVRAFKFRDPDGHPLELIWFPPDQGRAVWHQAGGGSPFLGIDHSALSVASTARSLRFYRSLGFKVSDRSWNHGPAQSRLDGLTGARVQVTGLRPRADTGPGLELLGYHPPGSGSRSDAANDLATDWVTMTVDGLRGAALGTVRDPDGHRLVLVDQGAGSTGLPA
jgi:catechol 2,3-dioxygenase-like lactoylglutathione lyase family enzyme